MEQRDDSYSCTKTGTSLGALTTDETGSLLEEILIQRRLELWGEDGRIYTIRRLRQGFERTADNGWSSGLQLNDHAIADPECYAWVLTIPATEFDVNPNMTMLNDQNPMGDYYEEISAEQNITFTQAVYNADVEANTSYTCQVKLNRTGTGFYQTSLTISDANADVSITTDVVFLSGQSSITVNVLFDNIVPDNNYSCKLTLPASDCASDGISSANVNIVNHGTFVTFMDSEINETANDASHVVTVYLRQYGEMESNNFDVIMTDADEEVSLESTQVIYTNSRLVALKVNFNNLVQGQTYRCTLSLPSSLYKDLNIDEQIRSVNITVTAANWESAGTCEFTDGIFDATSATVQVQHKVSTNTYRLVDPFYTLYGSSIATQGNIVFDLNDDGSITVPEGEPGITVQGYSLYYTSQYPTYCYTTNEGNQYSIYYLLSSPDGLYVGGPVSFTWNR